MESFAASRDLPEKFHQAVVAIGNFDGVHRGHQVVLEQTRQQAAKRKVAAGVMTFEPHPRQVFQPDKPFFRLTTPAQKRKLFAAMGLDFALFIPFDEALYSLSGKQFIAQILVQDLHVGHVITGYDFYFGKGRDGSPDLMRQEGARLGFGVTIVAPVKKGDLIYSSTKVREALQAGHVKAAAELLGYHWCVDGSVERGAGRGEEMGYPTANIPLLPGQNLKHGIYAVRIRIDEQIHNGAAYFGPRPTFDDGPPRLEIFVFDFQEQIYGKNITVAFIDRIRDDRKFADQAALIEQMEADCAACKRVLAEFAKRSPSAALPLDMALLGG